MGEHDHRLKVQLSASPVQGAANQALILLLADVFGLPRSALEIVAGHTSRRKTVRARGLNAAEARRRLELATAGERG